MKYNPEINYRKLIRLKRYDYSKDGMYFITICIHNREHIFGETIDNSVGGAHCMSKCYIV